MPKKGKTAAAKAKDYTVGRGKPPDASKFKAGQSGNPKGRPKGSKNFSTIFQSLADEKMTVTLKDGVTRRLTKSEGVVMRLVAKALGGDTRAMVEFIEQLKEIEEKGAEGASRWILDTKDLEALRTTYQRMLNISEQTTH